MRLYGERQIAFEKFEKFALAIPSNVALCGSMMSLNSLQIASYGPMIGFEYGEQIFENGCSSGILFSDVSASEAEAFWKALGRDGEDWFEFRRYLEDETTTVMMNHRLGKLFPVWYYGRAVAQPVGFPERNFANLVRESWDLSIDEEVIRLHIEREYQPSSGGSAESGSSIVAKKRWQWSWAAFRESIRIGIDMVRVWAMFSGR